ncbi:MAG: AI-2E family transporter [Bryobacteraceae bacterium]|nr:AI-2E family transporter [Bryobacteraceae bacterium]
MEILSPLESSIREPKAAGARSVSLRIIALAMLIALLYYGQLFLITMLSSVIIAFILEPFVILIMKLRFSRGFASFLACSIALLGVYLLALAAFTQISQLVEDLPQYSLKMNALVDRVSDRVEGIERSIAQVLPRRLQEPATAAAPAPQPPNSVRRRRANEPPPAMPGVQEVRLYQPRPNILVLLYSSLSNYYSSLLMFSFVPFLVYFMLSWRDHMRRAYLGMFHGESKEVATRSWHAIAGMARAYMAGNFLLGMVLALFSTIFFILVQLPYPFLIGPLSGFLSIVPYLGLPMALLPPVLAALPVYSNLGAYLIIASTVGFLHLVGLNLLYPKMVGSRVHLNPLAVTVALMFWGLLWGGAGLVLAIPITAGMKAVFDNVSGLEVYGRLLGD